MPALKRQSSIHDDFDAREALILESAIEEFCLVGYDAASVNSIATAAGISVGLVYKHVESKEHLLYKAIAYRYSEEISGLMAAVGEADGVSGKLRRFVELHLSSWRDMPAFNLLFFHETRRAAHRYSHIVGEHAATYVHCLEEILREGVAEGLFSPEINVRFIRDFLIGGLDHSVWWTAAKGRPIDVEGLTNQAIAYLLPNLLAQPAGPGETR